MFNVGEITQLLNYNNSEEDFTLLLSHNLDITYIISDNLNKDKIYKL